MATSAKVERIIHEVEALSEEERDELMNLLKPNDDFEVSEEWCDEINLRIAEIDEARVELVPHEEVLKRFREDLEIQMRQHA